MAKAGKARREFAPNGYVRWLPTISMMLVTTLSYIDRNTLALLAPTILRANHLSNAQCGFFISGFSISYMLANPLSGESWIALACE
jgi:ACS family hexuronate transporter-like MFS transporter